MNELQKVHFSLIIKNVFWCKIFLFNLNWFICCICFIGTKFFCLQPVWKLYIIDIIKVATLTFKISTSSVFFYLVATSVNLTKDLDIL